MDPVKGKQLLRLAFSLDSGEITLRCYHDIGGSVSQRVTGVIYIMRKCRKPTTIVPSPLLSVFWQTKRIHMSRLLLFPLKQLVRVGVRNSSSMACERLNESSAKKLIRDVDSFLFDCDGKTRLLYFRKHVNLICHLNQPIIYVTALPFHFINWTRVCNCQWARFVCFNITPHTWLRFISLINADLNINFVYVIVFYSQESCGTAGVRFQGVLKLYKN